ncbi:MAG: hypothetical protein NT001_00195 [Candidatus Woesearchaeota archaeon]|nr:hypothetical protein [Candidatus Woesearchaeota archaeon]
MAKLAKPNRKKESLSRKTESEIHILPDDFISKLVKYQVIIFISIALIAAIILRLYAAGLPVTGRWAASSNAPDKQAFSQQLKDLYKDSNGDYYLQGTDSYKYLGNAEKIINGDKADSFLPYLEAYPYKVIKLFDSSATLIRVAFWLPFVFSLFCVVFIFFIARKLTNNIGGFFASFLLAINPQFFTATQAGFTDTNFLNLFFILLITFLLFEAIRSYDSSKAKVKSAILFLLLILAFLLFKFTWTGYYSIIFILTLFITSYFAYYLLYKSLKTGSKKHIAYLFAIILFVIIIFFYAKSNQNIQNNVDHIKSRIGLVEDTSLKGPISLTTELFSAQKAAELRNKGENVFTYIFNGYTYIILTILSLVLLIKDNIDMNKNTKYSFFVLLLFAAMFFAGYNSIRFLSFFALPLCIVISYGMFNAFTIAFKYLQNTGVVKSRNISFLIVFIASVLLLVIPVISSLSERAERTPLMNDLIESAGSSIAKDSAQNAIINNWWDKGYMYHYYSKRNVLMDNGFGGAFDPRMYWFSRALLSRNESESLSIFAMLDCGQWSLELGKSLDKRLCNPPESFILIDSSLSAKIDNLIYFSQWNYSEDMTFEYPKLPAVSSPSSCAISKDQTSIKCGGEFDIKIINNKPKLVYQGTAFPVAIVGKDSVVESDEKGPYLLLVYPTDSAYNAVLMKSELLDSLFVKLYFMKGMGLSHFKNLFDKSNPVEGRIVVYKIDWGNNSTA